MTYDPYAAAFPAPAFSLTSADFSDGAALPDSAYADGGNTPPDLRWNDVPEGTRSFVLTAFDADAPIPGGLWHWVVTDIPASARDLPSGADTPDATVTQTNDLGQRGYSGAQPPPGTGIHHMYFCLTALDVPTLDLPAGSSTALLNITMIGHTLGRAVLKGTSTPPAD